MYTIKYFFLAFIFIHSHNLCRPFSPLFSMLRHTHFTTAAFADMGSLSRIS